MVKMKITQLFLNPLKVELDKTSMTILFPLKGSTSIPNFYRFQVLS